MQVPSPALMSWKLKIPRLMTCLQMRSRDTHLPKVVPLLIVCPGDTVMGIVCTGSQTLSAFRLGDALRVQSVYPSLMTFSVIQPRHLAFIACLCLQQKCDLDYAAAFRGASWVTMLHVVDFVVHV